MWIYEFKIIKIRLFYICQFTDNNAEKPAAIGCVTVSLVSSKDSLKFAPTCIVSTAKASSQAFPTVFSQNYKEAKMISLRMVAPGTRNISFVARFFALHFLNNNGTTEPA